jgi:peptidoglycan-associated lipoprotein
MKLVSKPLCLILASAALIFAGCSKKPDRPIPTQTAPLGSTTAGLAPTDLATTLDANSGLTQRTDDFDPNGLNRTALQGNAVFFDFDASSIKASEREKLKAAKDYLDKNPTYRLLLEGHCDWRGTAEYNLGLGDRRAAAAKKYLLSLGVGADKLETLSKGSLEAVKNADETAMAKDRRVDLVVSKAK